MGQIKGKTGNPNGRPKGVQNKVSGELKVWVQKLLDENRQTFESDLKNIDPVQRLQILEKMLNYCVPRLQSISIEEQVKAEYSELETLLHKMPDELIDRISEKVVKLRELSKNKNV